MIKYKPVDGKDQIAAFVDATMESHLKYVNSMKQEIEVASMKTGESKMTDDGKFTVRDVVLDLKDNKIFITKKLLFRSIVNRSGLGGVTCTMAASAVEAPASAAPVAAA